VRDNEGIKRREKVKTGFVQDLRSELS